MGIGVSRVVMSMRLQCLIFSGKTKGGTHTAGGELVSARLWLLKVVQCMVGCGVCGRGWGKEEGFLQSTLFLDKGSVEGSIQDP